MPQSMQAGQGSTSPGRVLHKGNLQGRVAEHSITTPEQSSVAGRAEQYMARVLLGNSCSIPTTHRELCRPPGMQPEQSAIRQGAAHRHCVFGLLLQHHHQIHSTTASDAARSRAVSGRVLHTGMCSCCRHINHMVVFKC
jgi:hypothetical protein